MQTQSVDIFLIVRFLHAVFGMAWWGTVFFIVFVLTGSLERLDSETRKKIATVIYPRIYNLTTLVSSLTITLGALSALLYSGGSLGVFLTPRGAILASGSVTGLSVYVAHLTVERKERSVLRVLAQMENPETQGSFLKDMKIIPRVGFILLTYTILSMVYYSLGI
ncbi:hypothetical protein B9Q04_03820 [Candidatus Marsarchaeota G2 archaeon BE_D]|jgi:hypothetical protein|uniref:Copper resistance protein D domain-containing protein n=1 Tax=Candidatus Marsarchaeota G2 archaeon BE_D TaxID=1978158 RepID=A0A2R6CDA7_9ARCH|nr:MAG: hypothetical protein B9Q04_03820 [Candidatus Marsarchaeota G2 archaeon BE_D]